MTGSKLVVCAGPRAAEVSLLDEVGRLAAAARETPELLRKPVRVIVPSRSLREHVAACLVRQHGAIAGTLVQTLRAVACDVLRHAGQAAPGGDAWVPVLVRRCASADPALRSALGELHDGYGAVVGTVGDLLDAGLEDAHTEGVLEFLGEAVGGALAARGRSLVRVARAVARELDAAGLEHRSDVLARAAAALRADPSVLESRAVLVHGFADVTGRGAELLAALTRTDSTVFLDHPPDPAASARSTAGAVFTERLRERLALAEEGGAAAPAPPQVHAFRAPGAEAEVREVAERCAACIDAGVRPEAIGIVVRELGEYVAPLRVQLGRVGVPFSGAPGTAPVLGPASHPGAAVLELLRDRESVPVDRWLDAEDALEPLRDRDLRLALHALGLARLGDVARFDIAARLGADESYRLPVRRGLRREEPEEGAGAPGSLRATPRRIPREVLEGARRRAAAVVAQLARAPESAPLGAHLDALRGLLRALGWSGRRPGTDAWRRAAEALGASLQPVQGLGCDEWIVLLERATRDVGAVPLGGAGGGVAVLSVVEARARTFERLFVLGLNRDRFPRPIADDPLLPDAVRVRLAELLPDVPVKSRGFDEERYLFAQLCSAAPEVTLSWQEVSDDGKERAPSPLVQRLLLAGVARKSELVGDVLTERPGALAPVWETGVRRGLHGDRGALRPERARIVAELDAPFEQRPRLGPYLGWTGPLRDDVELHVTRLEGLTRCAWQHFLERVLGLEPLPDARIALPGFDLRILGSVVNDVLERIATAAGVPAREPLAPGAQAHAVGWPDAAELEGYLRDAAAHVLRGEGIVLPGFAVALSRLARDAIERARESDWPDGVLRGVLGVEVLGSARVPREGDVPLRVRFRADRVDRGADGLVLTDYKTGLPGFLNAVQRNTRERRLLDAIGDGSALQGAAYAYAENAGGSARGRYLSLREDAPAPPEIVVHGAGGETGRRFEESVRALSAQREAGAFVPRLVGPNGEIPKRCTDWCEVRDACLQHDTRSRHRLRAWADASPSGAPGDDAARRGWRLGDRTAR